MENPETRTHMAAAIIRHEWSQHIGPEEPIALLDSMDDDMYGAALDSSVSLLPPHHLAKNLIKHLDAYLDGGHFEAFNRIDEEVLRSWTFDDDNVRDWARGLPERAQAIRNPNRSMARAFWSSSSMKCRRVWNP